MLVDIVLGSKAVWRVLGVLSESPGQGITKEEIKRITKLGGNSIFTSINVLLKNKIITSKKVGKRTYYKINLANKYSRLIVEIISLEREELNNINPKIVTILREFTRLCNDTLNPKEIYVFGSIVKNSYKKYSDIDIAIVVEKELEIKERIKIEKICEKLEKRFGREIQSHLFTEKEFKHPEGLIEQIYRDGIKLI